MSADSYITLTEQEKSALNKALAEDFGENRISQGAYIKLLAEGRIER